MYLQSLIFLTLQTWTKNNSGEAEESERKNSNVWMLIICDMDACIFGNLETMYFISYISDLPLPISCFFLTYPEYEI